VVPPPEEEELPQPARKARVKRTADAEVRVRSLLTFIGSPAGAGNADTLCNPDRGRIVADNVKKLLRTLAVRRLSWLRMLRFFGKLWRRGRSCESCDGLWRSDGLRGSGSGHFRDRLAILQPVRLWRERIQSHLSRPPVAKLVTRNKMQDIGVAAIWPEDFLWISGLEAGLSSGTGAFGKRPAKDGMRGWSRAR